MNRSQSWKKIPSGEAEFKGDKRATSHPNLSHSASLSTAELRAPRYSTEDLRRKIVSLNKELEAEKASVKQLRRDKSIDLKHAREEEQRRAASIQTELKSKLHKEKTNELTALREQIHKDKEKEILQIIKQKDDELRTAQQSWGKEKDELRGKLRGELWSEAREESRKEFYRERTRLEQEILDLKMQKKELEEANKTLQESDKRKADEIRRIFHEHEIELEKFKRNSWQESRRQMGEMRQLLNIIEQLERKLGIDSGHINKLRMEKEGLYEELRKKTNTFDAWDSSMSSSIKPDSSTSGPTIPSPNTDPKYHGVNQEIRTLQRKNTELSSLVKKLDEKNQQLATKNAELLSELERSNKDAKDQNKKLEKKNLEITQNSKKLESKNKALQDEINALKRKPGSASSGRDVGSKKAVRTRGQDASQTDGPEIATLKQQIKEQSKTIEELKQNLMEKERRIDLMKQRKKSGKKLKLGRTSVDAVLQHEHDDAASGVSDVSSDVSEMSSTDSGSDASKLKKLTKELLALERAYALLQAQVGGTVDVERDELERQQLQSDLIESQTRIHELERMMDNNAQLGQGGVEDLQHLQNDNKILYQKLIAAENERDRALNELSKNTQHLIDLQDKKDLLEFELEEMSQMSFAGSEDEFASPRKMRDKEDRKLPLSLEEVKAYLEEMENEKANVLNDMEIEALKQARISLTALPQKISHLEATEAVLRSKVKDLEERPTQQTRTSTSLMEFPFSESLDDSLRREGSSLSQNADLIDQYTSTDITLNDISYFENLEVKHHELLLKTKQQETRPSVDDSSVAWSSLDGSSLDGSSSMILDKNGRPIGLGKTDQETSTDLTLEDLINLENLEVEHHEMMLEKKNKIQQEEAAGIFPRDSSSTVEDRTTVDAREFINLKSKYEQLLEEKKGWETQGLTPGMSTIDVREYEDLNDKYNELLMEKEQWEAGQNEQRLTSVDQEDYENMKEQLNELLLDKEQWEAGQNEQRLTSVDQEDYENMKEQLNELLLEKEQWEAGQNEQRLTSVVQEDYENMKEQLNELLLEKEQWEAEQNEQRLTSVVQEDYENMKEQLNELLLEKEQWEAGQNEQRLTSVDQEDYENMKEQLNELLMEKEQWEAGQNEQRLTSVDQEDYENMKEQLNELLMEKEQWEAGQNEQRLTSVDQEDYENMKEQLNELLMEKEQWEAGQNEQRLTSLDQEDYENMKEQLNELLLEKEQWEAGQNEQRLTSVDQEDYENMKEQLNELLLEKEQWEAGQNEQRLTSADQEDYENMKEQLNELLLEKEQWEAGQNEQRLTSVDQEDYENMKEQLNELLMEKEQWEAGQNEQRLTSVDQKDYENMKEQLNELLMEKEQWEAGQSKMRLGPDDRKDYENLKEKYSELLSEKEHLETAQLHSSLDLYGSEKTKSGLGTSTDLTLDDLEYYENLELDYRELQESHQQLSQQYDAMNRDKNSNNKATETEMSLNDIQSLQDADNEYKNLLLTQQEPLPPRVSKDEGVSTTVSMDRLQYLEEVESIHKRCGSKKSVPVGTTTDLMLADLHYMEEVETVHQQCMTTVDNDISSSRTDTSDMGVGTELTAPVLEYLEEVAVAHKEIVREYEAFRQSVTKDTEDVILMTEVTGRHLDNLGEMAAKGEELEEIVSQLAEEKRIKKEKRRDCALMTELSLENLKNLERSGNIYTELKDRGILSRLEQLQKPKRKCSTVTDLVVSSIEYLEDVERLYKEQERIRNSMIERSVETDMTQSDLKRIENLANNAADTKKRISEKVTPQTSQDLLESSYSLKNRDVNGRHGDTGRHGDRGCDGNARGVGTVEIGIQCELRDLLSLIREQHEQNGGSADTKWFISEFNKASKEGFEPVKVVLRHGVRNSSTPDVTTRRDQGNKRYSLDSKRHSSNMSLNLDYGWQSTSSLDISGLDKTPLRGSGFGRWDSPRVPLAQDETFDLSDIESAPSEESLHHAMQTSVGGESVVTQFDRYVMARKQSEKDMLADIRENGDEEDGEPYQPKSMADLLNENEQLKIRNMELELFVAQKGDLSDDELHLLKQKIQQLREAEEQMEKLHDSNTALKDRINQLQEENLPSGATTSRSARDNWSEMDPSEGRTRLLLVQDWGLGESDLDSLFSAREGAVSPAESIETSALRRLLDEYAKSDHATQAGPAPGVSQEIQTTEDLVKLIDLSYDGTIPDHIAKELEKLKAENKELYQELLELRKLKLENSTAGYRGSRGKRQEEPIRASVQSTAETKNDWLTKLDSGDGRSSTRRDDRDKSKVPVKNFDELFTKPAPKPQRSQYSNKRKVKEPEVLSSRSPRDTKTAVQRGLRNLDAMDGQQDVRQRADTDDILDFEFGDDFPSEFAPPPVPSVPPPDLPDNEQDDMELGTETILGSSPPRDSRALRAASRQKNYPAERETVSELAIQAGEESGVEGEPIPERTEIPPPLRTNQTSPLHRGTSRPPATPKAAPPPTLPKPKMSGRRVPGTPKHGLLSTPLTRSRESLTDEEALGLTPRGYVRATASAINQGELDALGEKINFLEKQLKNKENVIRSMKTEATELEKQALLERREREIKILEEDASFLKQENHKKEKELLTKIGELNRKSYEADQWKAEANNAEKQRKRIEASYLNLQAQTRTLQGSDSKLSGLQSKYSTLERENKQLADKVKNLEKTEKEFKQLEYNISVLQNHLQDMESVEKERDDLLKKLKIVEDQRDDLLKKGRMVESERNDFLRNNKIMEMQRDELEQRYAMAHKYQMELKAAADEMEDKIQDANNKTLDAQHERNFVQAKYNKLEDEKNELEKRVAGIIQERNSLETRLAELEDRSREYVKLEDGFHTLRLKAAEVTSQRDDFEMQIPTLKAKVALLKKACKEKDEFIDKLNDEIRELRHAIATSTLDDLSKIRSYGYSPENFVKYSSHRDGNKKDNTNGLGDAVDSKSRSNGQRSPKSKSKNPPPKLYVAIFDYDPHKASVSGCPVSELTLKEGDELMVYGDMDSNGCYEAELNGVRGLVPGLYVEEVEDGPGQTLANGTSEKERTAKGRLTNGHCEPDAISSGRSSMSPRSSCPDTELQRQCYVALYDYNPYQSCTTGRPEVELPFKKGDVMTVIGEMDINGYYKAEMDGQIGLVPSNFVEDVASSTFLQPTSTTAPEQILGMLDNIKVPSPQRSGTSHPLPMPEPRLSSHPIITSIAPSGHMVQPVPMVTPRREQLIQPIFTPYMSPAEVHKLAAPISNTSPSKPRASQRSPRQQSSPRSRGITSQLSPSKHPISLRPMTSPPQITSQVQRSSVQPVNKPKPRQSKALVTSPQSVGHRGPPGPPSSLRVIRPVNHDAILLGWILPDMDEFGRSNGVAVKGYKIYENGDYKLDVRSQFMTKALVDDLDLRYPIQFTIRTIGSDGSHSSDVSTTFTDTINNTRMSVSKAIEDTVGNNKQVRIFVALYDYDPLKSSPNSNPQYELKFNEGDILRVEDTSRKDGFYFGSLNDKKGLIPSNFVEEVAVANALGPPSPSRKGGSRAIDNGNINGTSSPSPTPRHRKKMIALYDYNPNEQSPLDNPHNELSFRKGQEMTIIGTMNKDGYFNAEINGRKGLVPASFLESTDDISPGANKKFRS